jgi:hypothetical protein
MLRHVVWQKLTDVSDVLTASIIRAITLTMEGVHTSPPWEPEISCVPLPVSAITFSAIPILAGFKGWTARVLHERRYSLLVGVGLQVWPPLAYWKKRFMREGRPKRKAIVYLDVHEGNVRTFTAGRHQNADFILTSSLERVHNQGGQPCRQSPKVANWPWKCGNFSDNRIVKFRIKFSKFFNWTNLFHYLRLMAVVTE